MPVPDAPPPELLLDAAPPALVLDVPSLWLVLAAPSLVLDMPSLVLEPPSSPELAPPLPPVVPAVVESLDPEGPAPSDALLPPHPTKLSDRASSDRALVSDRAILVVCQLCRGGSRQALEKLRDRCMPFECASNVPQVPACVQTGTLISGLWVIRRVRY